MIMLAWFLVACLGDRSVTHQPSVAVPAEELLRDGMLIFRKGEGVAAGAVHIAQAGGTWTHVGVVTAMDGHASVVHAVPAERPEGTDGVVEDPFAFFVDPARASVLGLYEVTSASATARAEAVERARARIGAPFGIASAQSPDALTCTDLVLVAWGDLPAGERLDPPRHTFPTMSGTYVLPDDLADDGVIRRVWPPP